MKPKICLTAILIFLCSMQIVFAQKETQRRKFPNEPIQSKQAEENLQEIFELATISLGVLNDKAVKLPQPKYPRAILQPRSQGDVNVKVKINLQEGKAVSAAAVSGNPLFRKYAVEAAMSAEFQPLKIEGSPLYATGTIVYKNLPETIQETKINKRLPIIVVGVVNKKAMYLPKPIYPKSCRCLGTIKVQIVVDVNGKVISAQTDSGNPLLRVSAVEAARKTKFSPTFINGPPVFVVAFLEYRFYSNGKVST